MQIKQWEDKQLAQYSYGILSDCEKKIILIDPSRDPQPYREWAKENDAVIVGVIETHPHADFISSHLEFNEHEKATIYVHSQVGVGYPHLPFDNGKSIELGKIKLTSLHTPGHSPDSISILLEHNGRQHAVFTGDTLFIGDCGRPDLREGAGNIQSKREDLARQMYYSLRNILMKLNDDVIVYPAHGSGSLCGKSLSKNNSSTIGEEKQVNWSLQKATEEEFVKNLLADQPFIPKYFPYDVEVNRKGAKPFLESVRNVKIIPSEEIEKAGKGFLYVDIRSEKLFKAGHIPGSLNIMEVGKFETWLGSIVDPSEPYFLLGESAEQLENAIKRAAAIGYEANIRGAAIIGSASQKSNSLDIADFQKHPDQYTIIDVRNETETKLGKMFENSIAIPLPQLRNRLSEIPTDKPIVVHCAGGYRSALGSSILESYISEKAKVFDLGTAVLRWRKSPVPMVQ